MLELKKLEEISLSLDSEQINKLTEHTRIKKYHTTLKELQEEFEGLWYEIESVSGNWTFKDRVLPPLFRELESLLSKRFSKIKEFDDELFELNEYEKESENHKRKVTSLGYLIKTIPQKLHVRSKPSNKFSHIALEKTLRVLRKRFLGALERVVIDVLIQKTNQAKKTLRERITSSLGYKVSCYPNKIWDPRTLALDVMSYEYVKVVEEILQPHYGGIEYSIGLMPLWKSEERGLYAYYFTDNPYSSKEITSEMQRVVFIKEKTRPWIEIFEEMGTEQAAWFENWCSAKGVIKAIAWEYGNRFNYETRMEKPLTDEQIHQCMQEGLTKLQEMISYYGKIYTPKEFREYYEEELNRYYERSLLVDEIRENIKVNCMKLFPLSQLQEVLAKPKAEPELEQVIEVEP